MKRNWNVYIQKANAFKQLVQTRSNAEKTADFIRDDGDNVGHSRTDVSKS